MSLPSLSADIARRVPEMAKDSPINNALLIEDLIRKWMEANSLKRVREAAGVDTEWPVWDIIDQLILAGEHLLHDHDCDHEGHEAWSWAVKIAKTQKDAIQQALTDVNFAGAMGPENEFPRERQPLPAIGSRIRFCKTLIGQANGDHPDILYASRGELGTVTGIGCKEGYMVRTDSHKTDFGAVFREEFEII